VHLRNTFSFVSVMAAHHPGKDILNSKMIILKITPRIFFIATNFILVTRILWYSTFVTELRLTQNSGNCLSARYFYIHNG